MGALRNAPVAQLDRASDFGSEGREFESLRARQGHSRSMRFLASGAMASDWGSPWAGMSYSMVSIQMSLLDLRRVTTTVLSSRLRLNPE